jgi:hypothetical protein
MGIAIGDEFDGVRIKFSAENGQPGIRSVTFETANGSVKI